MTTQTAVVSRPVSRSKKLVGNPAVWLSLLSFIYFADLFLKASHKTFWYDELFTLYLCRLPSLHDTWAAVLQDGDYNPPVLYILTRGAEKLFGEGYITTRLPEMAGVWVFCFCLYLFVARRAGPLAGLVAGLFPFLTVVNYYAYEARPHGITVGWCGLALVCWQRSKEEQASGWWTLGFGMSLTGALQSHVYAVYLLVPFAAVELYEWVRHRRLDRAMAAALLIPLLLALPVYLSLFRQYRENVSEFAVATHSLLRVFAGQVLGAAGIFVLVVFVAISAAVKRGEDDSILYLPRREILLAVAFVCLPVAGLAGAKLSKGPFIFRYFLGTVAGYGILLGFASARRSGAAKLLAGFVLLLFLGDFARAAYLSVRGRDFVLTEPSSVELHFGPSPRNALARNAALLNAPEDRDVLVLRDVEYFSFYQYAPRSLAGRLYFGTPSPTDLFLTEYWNLAKLAHVDLKATTFAAFLPTHRKFSVYATRVNNAECGECIGEFLRAGYRLESVEHDVDGVRYDYAK